jgi:hypothetical protein
MGLLPGSDSAGLTGISSEVDASGSSVPAACFLGERMSDMRQNPSCAKVELKLINESLRKTNTSSIKIAGSRG